MADCQWAIGNPDRAATAGEALPARRDYSWVANPLRTFSRFGLLTPGHAAAELGVDELLQVAVEDAVHVRATMVRTFVLDLLVGL